MNLTEKSKNRIHLIYGLVMSVLVLVTGVLFITSCYTIYKSGDSPFTRESIGSAFSKIAAPVYVTIVAAVGGIVLELVLPRKKAKLTGKRSEKILAGKLASRVNLAALPGDMRSSIEKERRIRKTLSIVNIVLFVLEGTLPLIYLLNPDNFPAVTGEYNTEILHGMLFYVISLLPLLIFEVVYVILTDRSYARETALLKEAMKLGEAGDVQSESESLGFLARLRGFFTDNKKPIVLGMRIAFIGCALLLIVLGVINGGAAAVLQKAIKICTECIGLG